MSPSQDGAASGERESNFFRQTAKCKVLFASFISSYITVLINKHTTKPGTFFLRRARRCTTVALTESNKNPKSHCTSKYFHAEATIKCYRGNAPRASSRLTHLLWLLAKGIFECVRLPLRRSKPIWATVSATDCGLLHTHTHTHSRSIVCPVQKKKKAKTLRTHAMLVTSRRTRSLCTNCAAQPVGTWRVKMLFDIQANVNSSKSNLKGREELIREDPTGLSLHNWECWWVLFGMLTPTSTYFECTQIHEKKGSFCLSVGDVSGSPRQETSKINALVLVTQKRCRELP